MSENGQCPCAGCCCDRPIPGIRSPRERDREIEKSIEGVYSKFNVVGAHTDGQPQTKLSLPMTFVRVTLHRKAGLPYPAAMVRTASSVQLLHARGQAQHLHIAH